jgi:hypothetical protein
MTPTKAGPARVRLLLGDGTRLFEQPGGRTVRLEQISVAHTEQITNVWYRVVHTHRPHCVRCGGKQA